MIPMRPATTSSRAAFAPSSRRNQTAPRRSATTSGFTVSATVSSGCSATSRSTAPSPHDTTNSPIASSECYISQLRVTGSNLSTRPSRIVSDRRPRCVWRDGYDRIARPIETEGPPDDAGNVHVPDTYRTTYELLGSWAVAADQGQGSKQLHVVYASPGTIAAYRTDRRFPDGAVLVKEVFKAATGRMTTGTVSH